MKVGRAFDRYGIEFSFQHSAVPEQSGITSIGRQSKARSKGPHNLGKVIYGCYELIATVPLKEIRNPCPAVTAADHAERYFRVRLRPAHKFRSHD
jgi:hypothetical protein